MHRGWLRGWQSIAVVTCLFAIPVAARAGSLLPTPTLTTTPTYDPTTGILTDSAVLSGGNNPTGTITFTLYGPGNVLILPVPPVAVSGGQASWGVAFPIQSGPPAGTYTWDDSYSGDSFNNPVGPVAETIQIGTPEPSSLLLLSTGALGLFGPIRRKLLPHRN